MIPWRSDRGDRTGLQEVREVLQEPGAEVSLEGLSRFFRRHGIARRSGSARRYRIAVPHGHHKITGTHRL